ncbi:Annexin [Tothia fuscella]|uniref:Annexin n=1 Tax=Tothia fuscella TaxID=1048955 RepID=A0A9P4TTY5_9PEZI|nr:Annexin [Tothia fuscella]
MPSPPEHDDSDSSGSDPDEVTMGGYADLPPEERPGYMPARPGVQGVQYAEPLKPTFTPYPQWGHNAPGASRPTAANGKAGSSGGYQYAEVKGIRYTAKPVVAPQPPVTHTRRPSMNTQHQQEGYQPGSFGYDQRGQPHLPQGIPPPPAPSIGRYDEPPRLMGHPGVPHPPMGPGPSPPQQHSGIPPPPPMGPPVQSKIPHGARIKEVVPGGGKRSSPPSGLRPHSHSISGPHSDLRAPSPSGRGSRMNRLSVSGNHPDGHVMGGGLPPPSPLLEAYQGTWQSMNMPSPLMMARRDDYDHFDELDDLPPLDPRMSRGLFHHGSISRDSPSPPGKDKRKKKSVALFDEQAEKDAQDIAAELSRSSPKFQILCDILPTLTHDQLLELRVAYKRVCKIQGRGINIAKHIKLKTTGNLCKIAYVTALGRWESEGYWANFWYQSNSARRELLIEALMGRTNTEIRNIKDSFKDKRYSDDLVRCMDKELKADKFRTAVLLALEEKRQEENDIWPMEYRNRDVDALYSALRRRDGGETAILDIVVTRSDAHLRECLRTYDRKYNGNFAKDALRKSNNLVGEVVAHILNGVINRPARDAMLLHHAILDLAPSAADDKGPSPRTSKNDVANGESKKKDRYELLISRLVRLHWERLHFMRVKDEYREKYGKYLEEDIEDSIRASDFQEFCLIMCESVK